MKRAFEILVVAVASLGIVSVSLAGCCPPQHDRCDHAREARTADAPHSDASHCAPAPASDAALKASCCGGPAVDSPEYGLTKPLPLPGVPDSRAGSAWVAASRPHLLRHAPDGARAPDRRSPILRL